MSKAQRVAVFDTTLRDGQQAAGTRLGSRDKLTLARQLARLKVDIIEAGYPASSPEDFEAVERIETYASGMDKEQFQGDSKTVDAVVRNLEITGEAIKHLFP